MADDQIRTTGKPGQEPPAVVVGEKSLEAQDEANNDAASVHSESSSIQAGVQKAMILKKAWSRTTLLIAFSRLVRGTSRPALVSGHAR